MDWQMHPLRATGLEVRDVPDGCVVYQPDRDRLHHLNHTATVLLEVCDGSIAAAELPALLGEIFHLAQPPGRDEIAQCLDTLLLEGLLVLPTADGR